jgi:hypothetical protein
VVAVALLGALVASGKAAHAVPRSDGGTHGLGRAVCLTAPVDHLGGAGMRDSSSSARGSVASASDTAPSSETSLSNAA